MVFTTTPELEPADALLEAELLLADVAVVPTAGAGVLLAAYTVKVGGA